MKDLLENIYCLLILIGIEYLLFVVLMSLVKWGVKIHDKRRADYWKEKENET